MASAVDDPSTLCANMLAVCAKMQVLLLELKVSLQREQAVVRLQAAARGLLARHKARVMARVMRVSLSPTVAAEQQPQDGIFADQSACDEALLLAAPVPVRFWCRQATHGGDGGDSIQLVAM